MSPVFFSKLPDDAVVDILYLVRDPRGMENSREQLKKNANQIWTPHSEETSHTMNYNLKHVCSRYTSLNRNLFWMSFQDNNLLTLLEGRMCVRIYSNRLVLE